MSSQPEVKYIVGIVALITSFVVYVFSGGKNVDRDL